MNYKSPAYTPRHSNNPCSYHAPYNTYLPFYGTRDHYNYSPHPLQPKQLKRHPKNPPKPTWTAPLRSWVYEPTLMSRFDPVIFTNLLQFANRLVRHLSDLPGVGTEHHAPDLAPGKKLGENGSTAGIARGLPVGVDATEGLFGRELYHFGHRVVGYEDGAVGWGEEQEV